ncbi:cleavage induced hypothetical protein, partial [Thraustotheca clavata]
FEQLQSGVLNLDNALHGFILSLKAFHASSNVLLRAVEDVVNIRCSDNPTDSPEVKQFIDVFKACSLNIDITKFNDMIKLFETRVQKPSQGWLRQVEKLKTEIEHFNESHLTYDHYTKKVQTLRDAHNKRAGAGKQEKSKDVDKLVRNEQKLVNITNEYNEASDRTIDNLRGFLKSRDSTLLPLVQRIIEFRVSYAKEVFDLTSTMEPLLKISSYDENLERLESFAPSGHDLEGSTTSPKKVVETSEPDVQTLSFNDFVGTSPSAPAPPLNSFNDFVGTSPSAPAQDLLQTSAAENSMATTTNSWSDFNSNDPPSFNSNASTSFTSFGEQVVPGSSHIVTSGNFGSNSTNTVVLTHPQAETTKDFNFTAAPPTANEFNPFSSSPPAPFGDTAFTPPPPPPAANTVPHQQQCGFDSFDFMSNQ